MALEQRIVALHKRHEWLDQVLVDELNHPHPDEIRMAQIKKSKLRVKDEISQLEKMEHSYLHSIAQEQMVRKSASRH